MSIEIQYARAATRAIFHQLNVADTEADLEEWLIGINGPPQGPATDGWVLDNGDGTFNFWSWISGYGYLFGPAAVGDYIVLQSNGNEPNVFSEASFLSNYMTSNI